MVDIFDDILSLPDLVQFHKVFFDENIAIEYLFNNSVFPQG